MSRRAEVTLLLMALTAWVGAAIRIERVLSRGLVVAEPPPLATSPRAPIVHDVRAIEKQSVFRPAPSPLPPAIETAEGPVVAVRQPPTVELKGVVGGPPWFAVMRDPSAGRGDVVMRGGDSLGPVIVRAVMRNRVALFYHDTTWTVQLPVERRP